MILHRGKVGHRRLHGPAQPKPCGAFFVSTTPFAEHQISMTKMPMAKILVAMSGGVDLVAAAMLQ